MSNKLFLNYELMHPKLNLFCDRYEEILEEYKKAEPFIEFKDFTYQQNSYIEENKKGYPITSMSYFSAKNREVGRNGWHVAAISVNTGLYPKNTDRLPILTKTIRDIGNICACGINILDPDTKLEWHNDAEYSSSKKSFRSLWILDCSEDNCIIQLKDDKRGVVETETFQNNKVYSFFHSTTHRVENLSDKPRVAIAFDVAIQEETKYEW